MFDLRRELVGLSPSFLATQMSYIQATPCQNNGYCLLGLLLTIIGILNKSLYCHLVENLRLLPYVAAVGFTQESNLGR